MGGEEVADRSVGGERFSSSRKKGICNRQVRRKKKSNRNSGVKDGGARFPSFSIKTGEGKKGNDMCKTIKSTALR